MSNSDSDYCVDEISNKDLHELVKKMFIHILKLDDQVKKLDEKLHKNLISEITDDVPLKITLNSDSPIKI